ncbi:unnamed protein product [Callosobruchus maculatus]|uniref:INTS8 TPR repeats domain-containing protein n=1 Tax=Callosobruchus maculatus TaxID=64391 RepID=A0A653DD86_CALMS|nr:unnamed protein product [Callosobruchus maculatus]
MDVELLRPGTVPISPETVLWFEFLLDPSLLLKHLKKPIPDPSPLELITKFYDVINESQKNRSEIDHLENVDYIEEKYSTKSIALRILSLKIVAHLKWNLGEIRQLPFKTQITLLQDLMYFTNNKTVMDISTALEQDINFVSQEFLFALILFHRWLLNTAMHRVTSNWQIRYGINDVSPLNENIICSAENISKTISFLVSSLSHNVVPRTLTFDCFLLPTESNDNVELEWSKSQQIEKDEFCAQINYDLGMYFFYREDYELARNHFSQCLYYFKEASVTSTFYEVDRQTLEIYVKACQSSSDIHKGSLLEQLNFSIVNQYMGLTTILQQDNIYREIPLVHRLNLELDIQGAISSGIFTVARDLLQKIKALNIVRCILDQKPLYQYSSNVLKNADLLITAIQSSWKLFSERDRYILKEYLMELIITEDLPDLLKKIQSNDELCTMFTTADISYLKKVDNHVEFPAIIDISASILDISKKRTPSKELKQLEKQLISTNDHKEIRDILIKIAMMNLGTTVWSINPLWELPIPLHSVIKSLPRGFLQDYAYVTLAKSKEQVLNKNFNLSLEFLIILKTELEASNLNISKLLKLVSWEILLVQILQVMGQWSKNSNGIDKHALADACEACLKTNDSVLPRTEIVEMCSIYLLNVGRWEFLINVDKKWAIFEITSAIALTCQEIIKQKGSKKLPKNLWDLVVPIFGPPSQAKRSGTGFVEPSNLTSSMKNNLVSVFFKIKDSMCLAVIISLLSKLFNILKDESSLDLQVDYVNLWPVTISNANSYDVPAVCDLLWDVVTHALKEYPTNIPFSVSWLRLMGDLNFGKYCVLKKILIYCI